MFEPSPNFVVRPRPGASAGQWNAYVGAGETRDIRAARLAECPPEFRDSVERHVRTMWKIRQRKAAMIAKAKAEQERRGRSRLHWEP